MASHIHIDLYVKVLDKSLVTGDYYILVFASDGVNAKSEFTPIQIHEVPKRITGYLVLESETSLKTRIKYLNTSFAPDTLFTISNGYSLSSVNLTQPSLRTGCVSACT